ncbi:LOW QUALITY PROTEIN: tripartite motif-containing protein 16-like [Synchiropus picturatus]
MWLVDQSRGRIQQSIQERQEELKLLQQDQKTTVMDSQESLQQMIQNLQRRMSDVEQQIRSRQETEAAGVRGLQEQLEQEIAELKKKDAELQQLSLTDSHLVFLQNWSSPSEVSEDREESLLLEAEPKTRAEFLRFSLDITLDPHTAHSRFLLSEGNRRASNIWKDQSPPPHPDRFTYYLQVLSEEPLTGHCYWEVERNNRAKVAVSYKNISRSGEERIFGFNDKAWSLLCTNSGCQWTHNSIRTEVPTAPPSRVGVYLDHSAGLLSFYSVSGTMTLLHRVHTTFTQPLHAGVWVWASCEFLKL